MRVGVIIAAGGRGERLGAGVPKQLLSIGGRSILQRAVELFAGHPRVDRIVVVLPADLAANPPAYLAASGTPVAVATGGPRRQDSVANGFALLRDDVEVVVVHDAARPFASADLITRTIDAAWEAGAALAALPASDTIKLAAGPVSGDSGLVERTLPRERVFLAQTPQAFRTEVLARAIAEGQGRAAATDEAALAEAAGFPVRIVAGETTNLKMTTMTDLTVAQAMSGHLAGACAVRVGTGYDLHRLAEGRSLTLGGVTVPYDKGLVGHSDADVLSHALTDAILGALAQGDIGRHFPDTDPRWKGASSLAMLEHAVAVAARMGYVVSNVDAVVIAERPKLLPHLEAIRLSLASALGVGADRVSVKGKTNEGVGEIGRGEAMAVHAVAVLAATGQ